jgi:hypothetical protein
VIFGDGLTTAQNAKEEEFGDRLIDCCKSILRGDRCQRSVRVLRAAVEWPVGCRQRVISETLMAHR